MVIASMADLVGAIREGVIPEEVAYGRIVEALKRCQKTVFGDTAETAWCLLVLGAVITTSSGFGVDIIYIASRIASASIRHTST